MALEGYSPGDGCPIKFARRPHGSRRQLSANTNGNHCLSSRCKCFLRLFGMQRLACRLATKSHGPGEVWRHPRVSSLGMPKRNADWDDITLNVTQDYPAALTFLQRAIELNPYDGHCWLDLAELHQVRGERQSEPDSIGTSAAGRADFDRDCLGSRQLLSRSERCRAGSTPLSTAIDYDPNNTGAAIDLTWRATKNVSQIVNQVLPAQPAPYLRLFKDFGCSKSACCSDRALA